MHNWKIILYITKRIYLSLVKEMYVKNKTNKFLTAVVTLLYQSYEKLKETPNTYKRKI